METISEEIYHNIRIEIQRLKKLPTLSSNAEKIIELTTKENIHLDELVSSIENDPPIMSKVLSISNIAYFGFSTPITSIKDALFKIGFKTLKNIALSVAVFSIFKGHGEKEKSYERIFKHSVVTATICKIISQDFLKHDYDEAFVAGMLHDIGFFALNFAFYDYFKEIERALSSGDSLLVTEKKILGTDHTEIGKWLAEFWKFPESVCYVIAHHHELSNKVDKYAEINAIVHLSSYIAENLGYKLFEGFYENPFYKEETYKILCLPELNDLISHVKSIISEMEEI
ncbi:HDOD domain-containing protein [Thermodesulfovibrio hydrogeniphilus]